MSNIVIESNIIQNTDVISKSLEEVENKEVTPETLQDEIGRAHV